MHSGENRNRMWIYIIYILSLPMCQAVEEVSGNSTQMYYAKLKIDESVIMNISEIMKPFVSGSKFWVDDLNVTKNCMNDGAGKTCSCAPGHRWREADCLPLQCCGNTHCNSAMCELKSSVSVTGLITLRGGMYKDCSTRKATQKYTDCLKHLLIELKKVYSTFRGFDTLTIKRVSGLTVEFEMTVAYGITTEGLMEKSQYLAYHLPCSLELVTTGFLHLTMPPEPVCSNTSICLTCTSQEDMETQPVWYLESLKGPSSIITSGTISTLTQSGSKEAKLTLKGVTALWEGNYICLLKETSNLTTIFHKSSDFLDVALLPNIEVSTEPQFPRCMNGSDVLTFQAKCEITKSPDHYNVTWKGDNINEESSFDRENIQGFTVFKNVSCIESDEFTDLQCIFTNRCNQKRSASIPIIIIREGDLYCSAEGDWGDTKAGYTAEIKCKDGKTGKQERKCNSQGSWEQETSKCVTWELDHVLENAIIADTGFGMIDENAAQVSMDLKNVTDNKETMNSYPSLNTSVLVLSTLSDKLTTINNESTADDILDSSNNLLDESLRGAWETRVKEVQSSLAERFLNSFENLFDMVNLTQASKKANIELDGCNHTEKICARSVFNVTISLRSPGKGRVKTAGFKHLERYLRDNTDVNYQPNSIVVSAMTTKNNKDDIEIVIDFPLLNPRPRHFEMSCVFWDYTSRKWSSHQCEWRGPSAEGRCVCKHLSSFAILMSKHPISIKYETELTYFGLFVSIVSLMVTLGVEMVVWKAVINTNASYLRHTVLVNISLCLLGADVCFLASSKPRDISDICCQIFVVLKHFFYLSMFFWMLGLSCTLFHQAVFPFHKLSKKSYLTLSLILGYGGPFLIVLVTFLTNQGGAEGVYYSRETCWLVYSGTIKGSIYTFVIPVGVILFVNMYSMFVVIHKLVSYPNMDKSHEPEITAAKTVLRSVIILTPIFGLTWFIGFAVMFLDLTYGVIALAANYIFILLNTLQGLFILLTTCLGDQMIREALLKLINKNALVNVGDSSVKLDSIGK